MLTTAAFGAWGIACIRRDVASWSDSLPLVIFYGLLVANTFSSIRYLTRLVRGGGLAHLVVDGTLALLYAYLATSFDRPMSFALAAALLFAVATMRYAMRDQTWLLTRKLRVDLLGAIACLLALAAMMAGRVREGSWGLAVALLAASIYLQWLNPLYREKTPDAA